MSAFQLFQLPKQTNVDSSVRVTPGAKAYFYATTTTTPQDSYTTSALNVAHPNPVVADANGVFPAIYLNPALVYKLTLNTSADVLIYTIDPVNDQVLSQAILGLYLYPRTTAEIAASVTPTYYYYPPGDVRRYGAAMDGFTDDTTALRNAILVGATNFVGGFVTIPIGTLLVSEMIFLPNRVRLVGANVRGSIIKASASWAVGGGVAAWSAGPTYQQLDMVTTVGILYICKLSHTNRPPPDATYWNPIAPAMFYAQAGYSALGVGGSMFDSIVESLNIEANGVANLGCILSSAWQENSGPRRCLLSGFKTFGLRYQDGFGGASYSRAEDCEIFAHATNTTGQCVTIRNWSAAGGFKLHGVGLVFDGGAIGFDNRGESSILEGCHGENVASVIALDGPGNHVLTVCDGSSTGPTTSVVDISSTFTGRLEMNGCMRTGSTNLIQDNRANGYGTVAYDDDFYIDATSNLAPGFNGGVWSGGVFNGTPAGPAMTVVGAINIASVTKNGTGIWTVVETRSRGITSCVPVAFSNSADSSCPTSLVGGNSYQIRHYVGGVLTDSNEIKFFNVRLG